MQKQDEAKNDSKRQKNSRCFIKTVVKPLRVIRYAGLEFFVWIAYSLIGGFLGILVSVAKHWWFGENKGFSRALSIEIGSCSFYTYSIALLASVLSMVFIGFVRNKGMQFKRYKIAVITISILALIFGGVFYALSVDLGVPSRFSFCDSQVWLQFVVLGISILVAIYTFTITRLDDYQEKFQDISDSSFDNKQDEDQSVEGNNYNQ